MAKLSEELTEIHAEADKLQKEIEQNNEEIEAIFKSQWWLRYQSVQNSC